VVAARPLAPGTVERADATGPPRGLYRIALAPGQFLHVLAEQRGVDVALTLRAASGRDLLDVDSPNGESGPEHLYFVAESAGPYLLEVRRLSAARGGRCTIQIAEQRPALPADRQRAAACRLMSEADAAQAAPAPAARRQGLALYAQAALAWRAAGDLPQQAMAEIKLGSGWVHLGEIRSAVEHWEKARVLLEAQGLGDTLPTLQNDLGNGYQRLGDERRARGSYESALASARRLGDRREEVAALNNLALLEQRAGQTWSALVLLDEALAGWRELGDRSGEATTVENQGLSYTLVGKLVEARAALERAAALFRAAGDRRQQAECLVALGWVRFLAGDPAAARGDLWRALALERAVSDRRGEAVALDRLGSLASETGDFRQAASSYRAALALFRAVGDRQSEAHTTSNLGQALTQGGDIASGLRLLDAALELLRTLGEPSAEAYALFRRARAERGLGRLEAARQDVELGLSRLESIRDRAQSDDLRMTYLDSVHDQYELLVAILMDLHARHPAAGFDRAALIAAERSRARGLLDLVSGARRRGPGTEGSAPRRLRAIDESIRAAETTPQGSPLSQGGSRGVEKAMLPALRTLLAERQRILVELREQDASPVQPPPILGNEQLQRQLLDPDTVLLVYALGESQSFVWAVTAQRIESAVLLPRATLESAARRWHDLLARSQKARTRTQAALTARELSTVLLGPVAPALTGHRVAVVADGTLAYVPFGALPEPGGDGTPLLARHEVVVLPSASVLAAVRARAARRPLAPGLLAVLADPLLAPDGGDPVASGKALGAALSRGPRDLASGDAVTRSMHDLGLLRLDPLPFSRQEAQAILALAPTAEELGAVGAAASRSLVVDGGLERFRILHFATHALIHPSVPELSGIVLSSLDPQGRPQPEFLQSYQISDLQLPAELVVLSGCRSGLGKELRGEGLLGLTQSFFQAGATRVLVSLWDVGDEPTARLMEAFYRELLGERRSPAAALRAAQLALRQDPQWAAPYYWAGFELEGDWRPLRSGTAVRPLRSQ
jgi:CHAT domain-containing protein/tetratricopeptide (TPR) repeat protein